MKQNRPNISKTARHTALDSMLIKAKSEKKLVTFYLAVETDFTGKNSPDGSPVCSGVVENVDVYAVKINRSGKSFWINKTFIVGVEE